MNATSLARLAQLHPTLQKIIPQLAVAFDAKFPPWQLEISQGMRNGAEQHALYLQGRESTANVNQFRVSQGWAAITDQQNYVVTNADAGQSWHEFGCAVDVYPVNGEIDWNGNDDHWGFIVETGESLGLESGIGWRDEPHLQLKFIPISPGNDARLLLAQGGVEAVWENYSDSAVQTA
jgi:D-alanyl-D-alanine carboxypeptidase